MDEILQNFFNLDVYMRVAPYLLGGLERTLLLSALVIPVGVLAGLGLGVLSVTLKNRFLRFLLAVYIDFFRALPPLVLLIFIYFGLPFLGIEIPKLLAVAVGFMLNNASYYGEVFRAGLESVPAGQSEAARSTGLSAAQTMLYVRIPQATRAVLPDLISNTLEVVKMTTLASAVALPELLRVARDAQSLVYNPSPIVLAALFYLVLLWPVVRLLSRYENRHIASH
jgi:polar amino acid transport system permease protein